MSNYNCEHGTYLGSYCKECDQNEQKEKHEMINFLRNINLDMNKYITKDIKQYIRLKYKISKIKNKIKKLEEELLCMSKKNSTITIFNNHWYIERRLFSNHIPEYHDIINKIVLKVLEERDE